MSAQPYTPEEIDAYRPMPSAASPRRLMATVDDLTSRLDAATRERDELRERSREAAQTLIDYVGADGPMNVEEAARKAAAWIERLMRDRDAATRRADEVGKAAEAVLREFDWLVSIGKVVGFESIRNDLRAALRIDAAKEGRHA